jgi:hypothetical protein
VEGIEALRKKYINDYISASTQAGTVIANINMDLAILIKEFKTKTP